MMLTTQEQIGLRRLGLVVAPISPVDPAVIVPYLAELTKIGYRPTNPGAVTNAAVARWSDLRSELLRLRGGHRPAAPLFDGFPDRLPSFDVAELRFLAGTVRLISLAVDRLLADTSGMLVTDVIISDDDVRAAMDFSDMGWWPASSVPQDVERAREQKAFQQLLPADDRIEWRDVTFVTEAELDARLRAYIVTLAASGSSLREEVAADLATLIGIYGAADVDFETVRFTEIRALFVAALFAKSADPEVAAQMVAAGLAPDDVLRLFAALTEGDLSLHDKVRFPRLSRRQRRLILAILEASPRLRDVFRRRGLWLAVAKSLHVGEYAEKFKKTAAVFAELRTTRRDAQSVLSRFERQLADGDLAAGADILAAEAPSVLVRQLRRVAALTAGNGSSVAVATALAKASASVPLRTLLAARAQIADNGATYPRLAITKSGLPLVISRPTGHLELGAAQQGTLLTILDAAIAASCAAKGSWAGQRVWIDAACEDLLVPDQLRETSDGLVTLDRGSRVAVPDAAVLRLFVHWREPAGFRSDLDLSCVALDENFRVVEHVSWTNLANGAMVHSGDVTSAPDGASEFIDIKLKSLSEKKSWRYLAPMIFRYAGPSFCDLDEAVAGWMLRDAASSDRRTFDVATVRDAYALKGKMGTAMPFVYDIVEQQVLYLDAYLASRYGAMVESSVATTEQIAATLSTRHRLRPSIAELARTHAAARGATLVDTREASSISVALDDDATFNALHPETLLAELL